MTNGVFDNMGSLMRMCLPEDEEYTLEIKLHRKRFKELHTGG